MPCRPLPARLLGRYPQDMEHLLKGGEAYMKGGIEKWKPGARATANFLEHNWFMSQVKFS